MTVSRNLLRALVTAPDATIRLGRAVLIACAVWGGYAAVQVLVNGVVVDETVVPAQIINGATSYPAGHPHDVYYRSIYSLPNVLSAGAWALVPDPVVISAVRNWLFLFVSLIVPFTVTLAITRTPAWAHLAVAFVLLEAPLRYAGAYPMWVFPHYYSNGHIGLQLAVLSVALLAAGFWRAGGVLVGMMPGIHATLAFLVWSWAGLYFVFASKLRPHLARKGTLIGFAVGLGISVMVAVVIAVLPGSAAPVSPYETGLPGEFRSNFITLTDPHRVMFPWIEEGYLLHMVGFAVVGYFLVRESRSLSASEPGQTSCVFWLLSLGVGAWAVVLGAGAVQLVTGALPDLVQTAMPWRYSNVSGVLLVPFSVSAVVLSLRSQDRDGAGMLRLAVLGLLAAAAGAASPLLEMIAREDVSRNLLIVLWGVLIGAELERPAGRSRAMVALAGLFSAAAVSAYYGVSHAAYYLVVAVIGTAMTFAVGRRFFALQHTATRFLRPVGTGVLATVVLIPALVALPGRWEDEREPGQLRWDVVSETDRRLSHWLAQNAAPDDLVLTTFYPRSELQAKTGQPALLELETLWLMTYMPEQASVIGTMVHELYGVDYRDPDGLYQTCGGAVRPSCKVWHEPWTLRSRESWQRLALKYEFRLVLASDAANLDLPSVWSGGRWTMYEIPVAGSPRPDTGIGGNK